MDENAVRSGNGSSGESALPGLDKLLHPSSSPLKAKKLPSSRVRDRSLVHDAVVPVVLSPQAIMTDRENIAQARKSPAQEVQANMIISIWNMEDERYYTCTFTSVSSTPLSPMRTHARALSRAPTQATLTSSSQSSSSSPISPSSTPSPAFTTPQGIPLSISPFPPLAPPPKSNLATSPSAVQNLARMKDAIIDAMKIPIMVMWHDESLTIQNKATTKLLHGAGASAPTPENPLQTFSKFKCYTEDFERQLQPDEYPLTQLVRTRKPFNKWKIGLEDPQSGRRNFDCSGEAIIDESTGEFIAGILVLADVTEYKDIIKAQLEQNDQQFEMICDTMPQMVSLYSEDIRVAHTENDFLALDNRFLWCTWYVTVLLISPISSNGVDAFTDWFSRRWYDYTGLSVETCLGDGWVHAFHSEDVKEAERKWGHCLEVRLHGVFSFSLRSTFKLKTSPER